jgi:hypothetical protein
MIIVHLPFPVSMNASNGWSVQGRGRYGYYPREAKKAFWRDAEALYMTQKRALAGLKIAGPFTYHLILNNALRTPLMDGDNRGKLALDFAQKMGLIENDKLAEAGSWSWGPCQHGALLSIHPYLRGDV